MGAVARQSGLPLGGKSTSSSPVQHLGCDNSQNHNGTTQKSGSFTQFVVIWICLIKTSESHISHYLSTCINTTPSCSQDLSLIFSDYASVSFFHQRSCDSHSLRNYFGFSENSCVSACNQKWHCHSLFMLNRGTQSLFGSDALENSFFMQDGKDTTLSLADGRAQINSHSAAASMVDKATPTPPWLLFTLPRLCFSRPLTLLVEDCPVNSAGSLGSWRRWQTAALCCKYGKHGISFVEVARREQSGEYSQTLHPVW